MESLMLFALLPLGLFSLFTRRLPRSTAGFGFLAALAPVLAKGIGSLIGHKQNKAAEKQAEEARRLQAEQADKLARQQWDEQQNSPSAQQSRFKSTFSLGRLAGAMGGMDKLPPSIANYYQSLRKMPEYTGTSSYIPTPEKGGTGWDIAGGVADALGYLDTSKFGGGGGKVAGQTPNFNPSASASAAPSMAPAGNPLADLTSRLRTPVTLSSGKQITPFDPKLGRG